MSSVPTTPDAVAGHGHDGHDHAHAHNPHLAHHFDTPEQQIASGKLGMWVFLATEILMFGGLFCAYAVYRHNHPEVFEYAHQYLDTTLGAVNTVVLITSSLTMAWGVRLAQLGKQKGLIITLALTLLGGFGFMAIKSIEYKSKWEHHLGLGAKHNLFNPEPAAQQKLLDEIKKHSAHGDHSTGGHAAPVSAVTVADPNAGTPDAVNVEKFRTTAAPPAGLAPKVVEQHQAHLSHEELERKFAELQPIDRTRVSTFFQIYFVMTGLHGIHVVVGMSLIFWILVRAVPPDSKRHVYAGGLATTGLFLVYLGLLVHSNGTWIVGGLLIVLAAVGMVLSAKKAAPALAGPQSEFGPDYYAPVDIVGLYWHLVDLIWIFLFPLLYLIH